ncbi:MAG: hypothetical protein A2W01_12125 [Candidatus Solincola sediminis]|nr:MAG: hypothetical protein A2W01_12125 [Candidatus Solincola sediminis]
MKCSQCGNEVEGTAFCRFCGAPVQAAGSAEAAPAAAAPPPQAQAPQAPVAAAASGASVPFSEELAPTSLAGLMQSSLEVESQNAFNLQNKKLLRVNMAASGGQVLAKAGSMVA